MWRLHDKLLIAEDKSNLITVYYEKSKSKAVPLHTIVALGGRGGIASTHSWTRH
jgi:hypothetical protein